MSDDDKRARELLAEQWRHAATADRWGQALAAHVPTRTEGRLLVHMLMFIRWLR